MTDHDTQLLAEQFEAHREHLRGVGYRMLGSLNDADDAVQEAWLRLSRSNANDIENLGGWLTTVVARVSLDMLRARESRGEESLTIHEAHPVVERANASDPESEALLADSVGVALLVVLERLNPAERLAFVLHDMFALPFEEIGRIVGRSPAAARQLASRARRRVQGGEPVRGPDVESQRRVVDAFLSALRAGDFEGLMAVLDPDVLVRADAEVGGSGQPHEIRGARTWAQGAVKFGRMAAGVRTALINGAPGLMWAPRGRLVRVITFRIADGRITHVDIIAEPERLRSLELGVL